MEMFYAYLTFKIIYSAIFYVNNGAILKSYLTDENTMFKAGKNFSDSSKLRMFFNLYLKSKYFLYAIVMLFCFEISIVLLFMHPYLKYNEPISNQFLLLLQYPILNPIFESAIFFIKDKININTIINMYNKLYWYNVFQLNDISTPQVYCFIKDRQIVCIFSEYEKEMNENAIIKNNFGTHGTFVKSFSMDMIPSLPDGEFVVQERIRSVNENGHYRIITLHNHETEIPKIFLIYYLVATDTNELATNQKRNSNLMKVELYVANSNPQLRDAIHNLRELHRSIFKDVFIIGWDVMITDKKYYVLEGNAFPSTIYKNDADYFHEAKRLLNFIV